MLHELDISGGGLRRAEAPGHRRAGPRPQRQAAPSVRPSATGSGPDRGPACPTARAMRTPATRSAGKRRARKAAIPASWSSTRADRRPTRRPPTRRSPPPSNGGVRTDAAVAQSQVATVYPGTLVERQGDAVAPAQEPALPGVVLVLQGRSIHDVRRLRRRAAGRRAVLRRAHVDRLPGLHGRRGIRGAARRQGTGGDAGAQLNATRYCFHVLRSGRISIASSGANSRDVLTSRQ